MTKTNTHGKQKNQLINNRIKKRIKKTTTKTTENPKIKERTVSTRTITEVEAKEWNGRNRPYFEELTLTKLKPVLKEGSRIIIDVPHGSAIPLPFDDEGDFFVFFWSSPEGEQTKRRPPEKLWGYEVNCRDEVFRASGMGIPIIDKGHADYSVAELVDRKYLYIHHDLCHHGTKDELAIYGKILDEVIAIIKLSKDEFKKSFSSVTEKVYVRNWDSNADEKKFVQATREILLPVAKRSIFLYDVHAREKIDPEKYDNNERFCVFFQATVKGNIDPIVTPPSTIWGHRVSCNNRAYPYSGRGIPFYDSENGYVVAELIDNCLFIHHHLNCRGNDEELAIYKKILKLVISAQEKGGKELAAEYEKNFRCRFLTWPDDLVKPCQDIVEKIFATSIKGRLELFDASKIITLERSLIRSSNLYRFFNQSAPAESKTRRLPEKIFGIPVDTSDSMYSFSGKGEPMLDPDGTIIGEICGKDIYIYFDFKSGRLNKLKLFEETLKQIVWELNASPEEKLIRRKNTFGRQYVKACGARFQEEISTLRAQIQESERFIAEKQQQLTAAILERENAKTRLDAFEDGDSSFLNKQLEAEFNSIFEMKKVRDVVIDEIKRKLMVTTETLYCKDPRTGKIHEIGQFRIEINLDGKSDRVGSNDSYGVLWFNLTRMVKGYDDREMNAPHVFPGGVACLGNAIDYLPDLVGKFQFAAIVDVAINFIEKVNVNDAAGKHINKWPIVKDLSKAEK